MNNREVLEQVEKGYRMAKPRGIPEAFYDIMLKCWASKEEARPTFEFLRDFLDDYGVSTERDYREADNLTKT